MFVACTLKTCNNTFGHLWALETSCKGSIDILSSYKVDKVNLQTNGGLFTHPANTEHR